MYLYHKGDYMNWDTYFMKIAIEVGNKSSCLSRKIGSLLIKDNTILTLDLMDPQEEFLIVIIVRMMVRIISFTIYQKV